MSLLEKLFIGFWIWHTCEFLYARQSSKTDRKEWRDAKQMEIERLREEITYWRLNVQKLRKEMAEDLVKQKKEDDVS